MSSYLRMQQRRRACLGKKRYLSHIDAALMRDRCMAQRPDVPLRVYQCELCDGGWHLTSKPAPAPDQTT